MPKPKPKPNVFNEPAPEPDPPAWWFQLRVVYRTREELVAMYPEKPDAQA